MDDHVDVIHVDTSGSNVGRYQRLDPPFGKVGQGLFPMSLPKIPMYGCYGNPLFLEVAGQLVGTPTSPHEQQGPG